MLQKIYNTFSVFFAQKIPVSIRYLRINILAMLRSNDLTKLAGIYGTDKTGSHWYTDHYMTHFKKYRFKKIKLLEIGVGGYEDLKSGGESLRMWKRYFPFADIISFDIHDKRALQEKRIKIFKGSQVDKEFIHELCKNEGPFDIIIDDGSHINEHIIDTFKLLFPQLKKGGVYVIEDLQTSYWESYGGDSKNLNNPKTAMNYIKTLTDCLNYQEIPDENYEDTYYDKNIVAVHFYHNLVFIHKNDNNEGSNTVMNHRYIRKP